MKPEALTLGIETSCDETAASVLRGKTEVRSNVVSSQYVHSLYGGVVPELAARAHAELIVPVTRAALETAGVTWSDLDSIAVTHAPGLMGALLVGLPFAKALSASLGIPFIGVNHTEGHVFALRLEDPGLKPPFLAAVLSGGHTELIVVEDWCSYRLLGTTLDDACGEAFDKVAKLLGLAYPGGAALEALARDGRPTVQFPVPLQDAPGREGSLDFSFSGLKTAVLYYLRDHTARDIPKPGTAKYGKRPQFFSRADVAASFQDAAISSVTRRIAQAVDLTGLGTVGVSGGVAANTALRERLAELGRKLGFRLVIPRPGYCTDNAAMIAAAGVERLERFGPSGYDLPALARLPIAG